MVKGSSFASVKKQKESNNITQKEGTYSFLTGIATVHIDFCLALLQLAAGVHTLCLPKLTSRLAFTSGPCHQEDKYEEEYECEEEDEDTLKDQ